MELLTPGIGLIFWMTVIFIIVLLILGKWGWPVIIGSIRKREEEIKNSLNAAKLAQEEMQQLQIGNKKLLEEARKEKEQMLSEAKKLKEQILEEAKQQALAESDKIINNAKANIQAEKDKAMEDLKKQVAEFSLEIAEKILRAEVSDKQRSEDIISEELKNIRFN